MAPVITSLRAAAPSIRTRVCVTGQHREMLAQVLDVFEIDPDVDLRLMRPDQSLAELTSRAIDRLYGCLSDEQPDLVLVQGDTTTAFCASLAAFYHHIPVGHIEAGLRTGDMSAPWPEEANRVLISRLATLHFAPTEASRQNLLRENVADSSILVTGNTVIDALFQARRLIDPAYSGIQGLEELEAVLASSSPVVLITGHRRENFGHRFESICEAIHQLGQRFPEVHFVYPVHLNPNVQEPVYRILGGCGGATGNVHLIRPLPYLAFVALMDRCTLVLTDSGGIQEEAPSLGKPVLVMRDTTERPEGIEAGCVRLVGTEASGIVDSVSALLTNREEYGSMARVRNPYGDGRASERIMDACKSFLSSGECTTSACSCS